MNPQIWTYDSTLTTDRDKVRFLVGDVDDQNKVFDDNEVDGMLALQGSLYKAAAALADSLAARFAGMTNISVDGLSVGGDKAAQYSKLAASLRVQGREAAGGLGTPFIGGISKSEMDSIDNDTDRPKNKFRKGMNEFTSDPINVSRSIDTE